MWFIQEDVFLSHCALLSESLASYGSQWGSKLFRESAKEMMRHPTYSTQNSDPTYPGHQSAKPSRPRLRPGQRPQRPQRPYLPPIHPHIPPYMLTTNAFVNANQVVIANETSLRDLMSLKIAEKQIPLHTIARLLKPPNRVPQNYHRRYAYQEDLFSLSIDISPLTSNSILPNLQTNSTPLTIYVHLLAHALSLLAFLLVALSIGDTGHDHFTSHKKIHDSAVFLLPFKNHIDISGLPN
ncbi:uncharacterized protein LAJ45_07777 [Morchella importuna]|uniref:uncharacterized protein n=1 Tax=Morchella importuna TaxID=1174673 RepID=UPI001E8E87E6|nr:uncharacterized protein LAJ45_07777 [Morchella importuna]KAH8148013.1 hypothetical protein LAJ45_07777 [Morchella importuna]